MLDIPPILHEILAGRYVLKREIGRGGAAAVYLAHDVKHERLVAIKVLHPELSHALGAQRFLREIKLTASLQHPHILPIHDSGEADDQLYYVMPYVEGDSLRARLSGDSRLSMADAVRIGREVAGALAYAHERGVVHRDIKPENILFSGGHAVLADFGIARAINRANEKITQQGTITGTPAYMSPEQARDRAFDGRSDVYSLACVLYEAIAGVPPFSGDTPQQQLQARISRTPPLLREYRHDVPPPIEAVIARALSTSPDDRFDDARAFSAALSAAIGNSGETGTAQVQRVPLHRRPMAWAAALLVVVSGGAATTPQGRDRIDLLTGRIDTAQYAVVPFQYVGVPGPGEDQEPVSQGIYAAMREWEGLRVASDMSVFDAMHTVDEPSLDAMLVVARRAHAGKLVWGRVWVTGDSLRVRANVYDAIRGGEMRQVTLAGPRDLLSREPGRLRALTADLLRGADLPAAARSGDAGTRSVVAWRAYQEAHRSLAAWRVPEAMERFEDALAADPAYGHAHLWLGQLQLWRLKPRREWTGHAARAARMAQLFDPREQAIADALQALQRDDAPAACDAYDQMRGRDSLEALAYVGLAYCHGFDRGVVKSATATGWSLRGSALAAQRALQQAVEIAPAAFAALPFNALVRNIYIIETAVMRRGMGGDSTAFVSFPHLIADTLAFVALPMHQLATASRVELAPLRDQALGYNRTSLLALLTGVSRRLPGDADTFEALSRVLETRDELTGTPNGGYSAASALERATSLATDSVQRARLAAAAVRLQIKLGDFGRAAVLADSTLRANPQPSSEVALYTVGLAAFLGHERQANELQRNVRALPREGAPTVPALDAMTFALYMRAALGVCDDSLHTLQRDLLKQMDSYVTAADRPGMLRSSFERPLMLADGCLRSPADYAPSMPLAVIQHRFAVDPAGARRSLDSLQRKRESLRPGEYALDFTVAEARMTLRLGDTATAIRQLDLTLTALPTLTTHVLSEPAMAAAVGRSMVLRAELAARLRDPATAALWAARVLSIWGRSDPSLAPTLARMRVLASASGS